MKTWHKAALGIGGIVATLLLLSQVTGGSSAPESDPIRALVVTPTPIPVIDQAGPGGSSSASALVMIQGLKDRRLTVWPLDGTSPLLEVDKQVRTWPLLASTNGQYVLYSTDHTVMVLDVWARRAAIVGDMPDNGQLLFAQWSPDQRAVAYVIQDEEHRTAYYALPDGSMTARPMMQVPGGLPLEVGWLADGYPVVIALGIGTAGGLQADYYLYDPISEDQIALPPDADVIQPWSPWRAPDGQQQLYAVSTWEAARYKGTCGTGPLALAGDGWIYAETEAGTKPPVTAFELRGIYMDRPMWLNDGRIVFRATADPICTDQRSGVYWGRLGQPPQVLVEVEPGYLSDQSDKLVWSTSYALSPDQTLIAWSENDVQAGRGWVRARPLDEGDPITFFETAPITDTTEEPFVFRDRAMILYFIWLL